MNQPEIQFLPLRGAIPTREPSGLDLLAQNVPSDAAPHAPRSGPSLNPVLDCSGWRVDDSLEVGRGGVPDRPRLRQRGPGHSEEDHALVVVPAPEEGVQMNLRTGREGIRDALGIGLGDPSVGSQADGTSSDPQSVRLSAASRGST